MRSGSVLAVSWAVQNPQAFPARDVALETCEAEELSAVQAERQRRYVRLRPGLFRGHLRERSDGVVALGCESWSMPLHVRCGRPSSYVVFSAAVSAQAVWCGLPIEGESVLQLERDWEITTDAPLEAWSFGVERSTLERAEGLLAGGEREKCTEENRTLSPAYARVLRQRVASALAAPTPLAAARQMAAGELLHLAATLRRAGNEQPARVESPSLRRAAVRRVDEYLDAHERELPSLAELCGVAGTSERTLEYAFREQLGIPLVTYRRLRRLNAVRRELRAGEPETSVSGVAMRWGFWQLGRFAVEYRALFGERPSDTLWKGRAQPGPGAKKYAKPRIT
jgi:AraC family ethanolamine operon transcriptional activator